MNTDTDSATDGVPARSGQQLMDELAAAGGFDALFDQIDSGDVQMSGAGGFVPALIKAALERGLQGELTDHLSSEKGSGQAWALPNSRNGTTAKTLASEADDIDLDVAGDCLGTFDPKMVRKRQHRLLGLDDMIIPPHASLQWGCPQACLRRA